MKRAAIFGALLLAMFIATGTAWAMGESAAIPTGSVVLVGDSNLVVGASALDRVLLWRDNGWFVTNIARPGSSVRFGDCPEGTSVPTKACATNDYWRHRIAALLFTPDVTVVELGINDAAVAGSSTGPGWAGYDAKIDWLLSFVSGPVLWTNLPCKIEPRFMGRGCALIDQALQRAPARHPNLTIVDWATKANAHPGWLGPPLGVHLTPAGATAYARLVASALGR